MALNTYAALQAEIASWLHRDDLTSKIPTFIALAESQLSTDLEARAMETRSNILASAGGEYVSCPGDMLEMRRLMVVETPIRKLRYVTPDQLSSQYPLHTTAKPEVFTVIGNQFQLAPIPDVDYTLELTYVQKIPALSDSNTSNWLLTSFPNCYLYGALIQAQPFIMNDDRMQTFYELYKQGVNAVNQVDWYSGATMTIKTDVRA